MLLYQGAKARDVLAAHAQFCADAPDELTTVAALLTAPPEPFVSEEMRGRPALGIVGCHCGDAATDARPGAAAFAPLRSAVPPDVDLVQPMPYTAVQQMLDAAAPHGMRGYWKPGFLAGLPDALIDAVVGQAGQAPSPLFAHAQRLRP
ncbi:MAG: FAD-linked oxidase, partial [Frankiaceae bacterium]